MWFWEFRLVDFWVPRMFRGCVSSAPLPSNIFLTFLSKMMFTTINFKDSIDSVTNIFVHWNLSDISCIARFLPYYQKCHLEQKGKRKVLFTFNKLKSDNVLFLNMRIRHTHKMSRCFFYIFMCNTSLCFQYRKISLQLEIIFCHKCKKKFRKSQWAPLFSGRAGWRFKKEPEFTLCRRRPGLDQ